MNRAPSVFASLFPSNRSSAGTSVRREPDLPLVARLLLIDPSAIEARLETLRASGRVPEVPSAWQIFLGVVRMWERMIFRSETVGQSSDPVRDTWRAKRFAWRPLRFPFLLMERAIAPLDFSGLISTRERVLRHLLGAHHDANQFVYDLEMLSVTDDSGEALRELLARAREVATSDSPHSRFLRDLVVYEGYHRHLVEAVEDAIAGKERLSEAERVDPDISFLGYLAWCAKQPKTPRETITALREGRFTVREGVIR